jgi:hypothetical protein
MTQLTDERLAAPDEARLFGARYDEGNPCKARLLHALAAPRPDLVPILADNYAKGSAIAVELVERKITWGEFARRVQALSTDFRQKTAAADRQLVADLNASSQAEMAQRQAAGAALMQWSAQQQMINAINRPVVPVYQMPVQQPMRLQTNCTTIGNITSCN